MMSSPAVQVVKEMYEAFARRDVAKVFSHFAPDLEIRQSSALPWGGVYQGHAGARLFFERLTQQINSTVTIERMIDAVEHVVVIGRTAGRVNATSATYDVPLAHVWSVREGLVTRVEFHIDTPMMLAALARRGGMDQ
jgi:uncharacterized protein